MFVELFVVGGKLRKDLLDCMNARQPPHHRNQATVREAALGGAYCAGSTIYCMSWFAEPQAI